MKPLKGDNDVRSVDRDMDIAKNIAINVCFSSVLRFLVAQLTEEITIV